MSTIFREMSAIQVPPISVQSTYRWLNKVVECQTATQTNKLKAYNLIWGKLNRRIAKRSEA